jgi:hypothetical protein
MRKLLIDRVSIQLLSEKFKENFNVSSEGSSSARALPRSVFARNVEVLLVFFR